MNIYKRRWRNALKIGAKINRALKNGYIVINEFGEPLPETSRFKLIGDELVIDYGDGIVDLVFKYDREYDEGYHTKITDFNKKFESWKFVKPENILEVR